jgi:Plavaka transposase
MANIIDEPESEPRYYLRSQVELESEENLEENVEEMKIDLQEINFVDCDFDREDL